MSVTPEDVKNLLGGGWGALDEQPEETGVSHAHLAEQYRVDKMFFDTFNAGAGAEVLDHLRVMTIEQAAFNPDLGLIGVLQGFSREGQDSIVRYIEGRMKRAVEGPPKPPEPAADE